MSSDKQPILAVPTNIITGFLGVGKTSAILNLLKNKPNNERWAVLVNEFGEIGVDGSLFEGQHTNKQGVFIREVPGGCMCCTAGLPMQIALNQLLSEARPDRLLIEPTGLGHPKEVLQVLTTDYYREILNLQKTITLVDARKLADSEYAEHDTFIQQVAIADTVVGNKVDLYSDGELKSLTSFVVQHGQPETPVLATEQGKIEFTELEGKSRWLGAPAHHHHHHKSKPLACELLSQSQALSRPITKAKDSKVKAGGLLLTRCLVTPRSRRFLAPLMQSASKLSLSPMTVSLALTLPKML